MNQIKSLLLVFVLASVFGCASHKPKEDKAADGALSANVSNDPISSTAEGSDSGKYAGLKTVHFDFDQAAVTKSEREWLKEDAQWIKSHSDTKIQIEGHCDARGSVEYNLALGDRRAKAVMNALVEMGIPKSRLSTISYGEERPLAQGDSEEAYAKNRRANFVPLKMDNQPVPHLAGNH